MRPERKESDDLTDRKENTAAEKNPAYPQLPESYKNRFAFSLATTSFIYPDHILPNVLMLAPFLDEIELLLFESAPAENLPRPDEIRELHDLCLDMDTTCNIHLPIDVSITEPDKEKRSTALNQIAQAIKCVESLAPSTWTLHLPYVGAVTDNISLQTWQDRAAAAVKTLLRITGIAPRRISVETLDYPPLWLEPVAEALDLSVCLDIGHLMEYGFDIAETFKRFKDRISILHLYGGVEAGRGHVGLDRLPGAHVPAVKDVLSRFTGTVSLEVFSYEDLKSSLAALKQLAG